MNVGKKVYTHATLSGTMVYDLRPLADKIVAYSQQVPSARNTTYLYTKGVHFDHDPTIGRSRLRETPFFSAEDARYQTAIVQFFASLPGTIQGVNAKWIDMCYDVYVIPFSAYQDAQLASEIIPDAEIEPDWEYFDEIAEPILPMRHEPAALALIVRIAEFLSETPDMSPLPIHITTIPAIEHTMTTRNFAISLRNHFVSLITTIRESEDEGTIDSAVRAFFQQALVFSTCLVKDYKPLTIHINHTLSCSMVTLSPDFIGTASPTASTSSDMKRYSSHISSVIKKAR